MKVLKLFAIAFFASVLIASAALTPAVSSQSGTAEAPASFDNLTNGFTTQAQFDEDRAAFEAREEKADGLGPVYNAQACVECHQNRVTGGVSQIFELRAGHTGPDGTFVPAPGGSLVQSRSLNTTTQERVPDGARIAYVNNAGQVSVMSFDGGESGVIGNSPVVGGSPSFSPDGTQIAFHSDRDGNFEIYKMTSTGALQTRLTNNPAQDKNPAWAPDNTAIAFGSNRNAGLKVWAVAPDGTNTSQLNGNNDGGGDEPSYSRDQGETVRTFRASPILVGLGFVEAIDDATLLAIRDAQPAGMRGTAISVPLLEAPGQTRLGRFGWKNSVASLLSFSAGAYLFEMGITSPLLPNEQTSLGRNTAIFDTVPDPEDTGGPQGFGEDVEAFTRFMRATKAPPRNVALVLNDATDPGSALFDQISCSVCHVRSVTTAPAGTFINGGTFMVPPALGGKVIHPFSDFLLHDIGTGDGIVETNGEVTRNKMRTALLWGLRTHDRFMHDGGSASPPSNNGAQSFTLNEAILRHGGQAASSRTAYQALTARQKAQLIRFLKSL